ncbi:MAG: gamma-glutamyl-gamma-aminobutyrate hydrolase family protein [Halanaerobiaceae bacterium]
MTVIGVTIGYSNQQETKLELHANYLNVIKKAGGLPVILPPQIEPEVLEQLLDKIDGLLFSGGTDVDPYYFGEEPKKGLRRVDPGRDKFEMKLVNWALEKKVPVLALCRGIQVLNIALGGTIIQHLDGGLKHEQDAPYSYPSHKVFLTENGYLQQVYGKTEIAVNSFHHQALQKTGSGLKVEASSSDGIVEAVSLPDHPFVVGVQWHPERMYKTEPLQLKLFQKFVRASSGRKNKFLSAN